ncbi:hypothetical protein [Rhodoblastus sp.]|uniref:hypothetical protein n=1 Tax=Rhodoblastus sp. TaxID=1962975 RepID=UPI003F9AF6CA
MAAQDGHDQGVNRGLSLYRILQNANPSISKAALSGQNAFYYVFFGTYAMVEILVSFAQKQRCKSLALQDAETVSEDQRPRKMRILASGRKPISAAFFCSGCSLAH